MYANEHLKTQIMKVRYCTKNPKSPLKSKNYGWKLSIKSFL